MQTHQQNTANPAAAGHSILSTHFDLDQFDDQVTVDAGDVSADMPPSLFDDPAFDAASATPQPAAPAPTPTPAPVAAVVDTEKCHSSVQFKAVRIARAHSGTSELRLVEEMVCEGVKPHFYFEEVQLQDFQTTRMLIVSTTKAIPIKALKSDDAVAVTIKQAEKYFAAAVARKYPSETTRGGITMATHINVL